MSKELATGIRTALARNTASDVEVRDVQPLYGGACQDNYRVDALIAASPRRYVLRSDAVRSLPGSLGRREEFEVIRAAHGAGVPTPAVHWLVPDLVRAGAFAYFMDWVPGEAIGAKVLRDPALAGAREKLPSELANALAAIHRVNPREHGELGMRAADADPARAAIAAQYGSLDQLPEARPALELALDWLRRHAPAPREITLVHGDFRTGNFMVTPNGLAAVLDWEFAHWGDPFEDLAWLCVRDWRFGQLDRAAGGLCKRDVFYAEYERASGRKVDRAAVHFWEVLGNVRWALGAFVQGLRYIESGESDIELVAIARRAVEMEMEALRLIEEV
jgi:aminoglycoside phosphotransferase (APT) family kinase protein